MTGFFPLALLLVIGLGILQGCGPSESRFRTEEPASPSGPPEPAPVGASESASAVRPPLTAEEREVLDALRDAFALESELWEHRDRFQTSEDVQEFLRQGFCEEPARQLAEYVWMDQNGPAGQEEPMLRVGEPVLTLPDDIRVQEVGPEQARVLLNYPEVSTGPVTSPAQTVRVLLRRAAGAWKVCSIESEGVPPP